jgi:Flp pilus assembly protein TadD
MRLTETRKISLLFASILLVALTSGCATPAPQKGAMVSSLTDDRALTPAPATTPEGKAAAAKAKTLGKKAPKAIGTLLAQARVALTKRDHRTAEDLSRRVLSQDFRNREAKLILAHAAVLSGRFDDARAFLRLLGGDAAPEAAARNLLGVLAWEDGDAVLAENHFTRAVAADAADPAAHLNLGLVKLRKGDLTGAEKQFRECLKRAPNNPDARLHLGATLARRGKLDDAQAEYKSIAGWQENPRVLYGLALVHKRASRYDDAIDSLAKALEGPKLPLAERDALVALLEEIRADRAARDPEDAAEADALIAEAKKGRSTSDDDAARGVGYFLSGVGPDSSH